MSGGRTTWWPCDGAEHDRELNVELGEEFGPGGPLVMRVLKDLAQQQRDADGEVRSGFRVLRKKCFLEDPGEARRIIEHAAEIGALDGLEVDADGRRFACRVSGWRADQTRGREALKKAAQRGGHVPLEGDKGQVVPSEGDVSPICPPTIDNLTREEGAIAPSRPEIARLCSLLADLIEGNGSKRPTITDRWRDACRLLIDRDGRTEAQVENAIRWCQSDEFWRANVLSMPKLREQYDQLRLQAQRGGPKGGGVTRNAEGLSMHPADVRDRELVALAERLDEEAA